MKQITRFLIFSALVFCLHISFPLAQGCKDRDNDGYYNKEGCGTPVDCDDNDPITYPGAPEILCNGEDEDCDGTIEDDTFDNDNDGYDVCGFDDISNPDGLGDDCNDGDASIYPGSFEICDGFDNDCNGSLDEGCEIVCDDFGIWGSDIRITYYSDRSEYPSLVWTGNGFGISWKDERDGNEEIYFARLDSAGNKIGTDIRVTNALRESLNPSLAWTGSKYGVSWEDDRDGNDEIYFARLDSTGNKISPDLRITYDFKSSDYPSLVWTGTEYGVVWDDFRGNNREIYFARIDSAGSKLGSDVRVTYHDSTSIDPSLVWSGSEYGIAWRDDRDGNSEIYFVRLDPAGNKIGSDVRVTNDSSYSRYPSLVWSGSEYGLSWWDQRDGNTEIYFARIDSSGNKIGSDIRVTYDSERSECPSLVWTGSEYGVSWEDDRDGNYEIYFARLDSYGYKIDSDIRITNDSNYSRTSLDRSLVWTGAEYFVSWHDGRHGYYEIYVSRLACCDDDIDLDTYNVCQDCDDNDDSVYPGASEVCDGKDNDCDGTIDNECCYPGVDKDADGYDECEDCDDDDDTVYPGALEHCDLKDNDCDGSLDEGCPTSCDNPNIPGPDVRVTYDDANSGGPSLAWTGTEYGMSWGDNRDGNSEVYFARLDSSGNKLGSDVRVTYDDADSESPSLAWTGTEYGMSWRDERSGNREIFFARLDSSGNKIGSDVRVTYDNASCGYSSLTWTGTEYGVAWDDFRDDSGIYENDEIYFARLDASGNKIGSDVRVTYRTGFAHYPSLVWTGNEYGVSWWEYATVYFARLNASGNKIGSDMVVSGAAWIDDDIPPGSISLVWNGNGYGVSWNDYEGVSWPHRVWFARIDSYGNNIGSDLRLTFHDVNTGSPHLAWTGTEYGITWSDAREGNLEIYFARIHSNGNKIGSDLRITNDSSSSGGPFLAWVDVKYEIAWSDYRDSNNEIYLTHIACCDADMDADSDTHNECDDCDDNDADVYPGATELCDDKDNNCDGTIDEGFTTPGITTGLVFLNDKQILNWNVEAIADRYDVMKGDLMTLRSSLGDFTSSLMPCLENDSLDTESPDTNDPEPGEGFYYLVRAQASCKDGTCDCGQPSQVGERDSEIDESPNKCP